METIEQKVKQENQQQDSAEKTSNQNVKKITPAALRELGIKLHNANQLDKAVGIYKAYLYAVPHDAAIWSNLGAALRKQKRYQLAVSCYQRGLEINPNELALLSNLANVLKDLHRLDESIALHQKVVERKAGDVQALMNYACALREAGRFAEALEQLDKAQALEPDTQSKVGAGVEWERAQNLLYLGNYKEGWQAYEARWRTGDLPEKNFAFPSWQGEELNGKTLLVHTEQGYGDTILAARCIPLLKQCGATVILQCKPELHRLFANVGADQLLAPDIAPEEYNYHCPAMSLFGHLGVDEDSIPSPATLTYPEESANKFSRYRKGSQPTAVNRQPVFNVGIVWSGSVTFANNFHRSLRLEQLIPFSHIPGVRLFSFQKGPRAEELYRVGADGIIQDIGKQLDDFADTAAAIDCMDAIVMTDSSVAHLAASMGKPVINLIEKVPYWLYRGERTTSPWYPSMTLVRQQEPGQWDSVVQRAIALVKEMAESAAKEN